MIKALHAVLRGVLVATLVMAPGVLMPGVQTEAAQAFIFVGAILGVLVFVEYRSDYPSVIEYRDAKPYNRVLIGIFAVILLGVTLTMRGWVVTGSGVPAPVGALGAALDFPFSPLRLLMISAGGALPIEDALALRAAAGLAYALGLAGLVAFAVMVRILDWPLANGAFNVWTNLPLFDPTGGGDVLKKLSRDAHVNVSLGFLLPFMIPAALQAGGFGARMLAPSDPLTVTWVIALWGFMPTAMIMRGIALMRVADLIAEKRRRAYRQSDVQPV